MASEEVQKLLSEIDTIIERYSQCPDKDIQKTIRKLKRSRKKFDSKDIADAGFKILWLADKVHNLLEYLS